MRVSIALATYNGAEYLSEQLNSLTRQTLLPDEVVVIDDCSTDATISILEAFKSKAPFKVRIIQNDKNYGHSYSFERALKESSGELIFISDQDDTWSSRKIELVVSEFLTDPDIGLIVNDAFYADHMLNHGNETVLQNVLKVGGRKDGHIAGACTAMTRRFRDFVIPFPLTNCPQYDVYIHRWANLMGNKKVIEKPLQSWRIHDRNATSSNEMSQAKMLSPLKRYMKTKNMDPTDSYLKKAAEFEVMQALLKERSEAILNFSNVESIGQMCSKIDQIINANLARSELGQSGWFKRKRIIFLMIVNGQYHYFKGLRSIAKDLLR